MNGWQKGDLALCVRPERIKPHITHVGGVYEVERVWTHPDGGLSFDLVGLENGPIYGPHGFWGYNASRFVKVTPPKDMKLEPVEIEVSA